MDLRGMIGNYDLQNRVEKCSQRGSLLQNAPTINQIEENRRRSWADLPADVLLAVVAKLAIWHVGRLRTVCRNWNSAIPRVSEPSFASCCVVSSGYDVRIYDTGAEKWYDWEMFPPNVPDHDSSKLFPSSHSGSSEESNRVHFQVLSAAGSLLLLQSESESHLTVFNPLNKSHLHVSRPLEGQHEIHRSLFQRRQSLAMDDATKTWMLFDQNPSCTITSGIDERLCVYTSGSACWEENHEVKPQLSTLMSRKPVLVEGRFLYYLPDGLLCEMKRDGKRRKRARGAWGRYYYLAVYDLQSREAQVLSDVLMPNPLLFAYLFGSRGRIMLLGGRGKFMSGSNWDALPSSAGVFVWELSLDKKRWVEVGRMPTDMVDMFFCEKWRNRMLHFAASSDGIGMLQDMSDDGDSYLFLFDMRLKNWSRVPAHIPLGRRQYFKSLFMFQPRMDMIS